MADSQNFDIKRPLSKPMRFFLGAVGIFCILTPTFELRHAIIQPGWWTLFFGAIIIGAWSVGGIFLAAAILGEAQHWRFRNSELILSRKSPFRYKTQTIRSEHVERTDIREVDWDSRANTYSVVLHLKGDTQIETPDYDTRAIAEAMEQRIRLALRLPTGPKTQ